ncbi:hypothetical protein [Burkholderia phage vB_BglM_WTB]
MADGIYSTKAFDKMLADPAISAIRDSIIKKSVEMITANNERWQHLREEAAEFERLPTRERGTVGRRSNDPLDYDRLPSSTCDGLVALTCGDTWNRLPYNEIVWASDDNDARFRIDVGGDPELLGYVIGTLDKSWKVITTHCNTMGDNCSLDYVEIDYSCNTLELFFV